MVTKTAQPALPAKADKAVARQIAQVDESLENVADFIELMRDSATRAPFAKELTEQRKRLKTTGDMTDAPKAAKELALLAKEAKAMLDRASYAARLELAQRDWHALRSKAAGLLAEALVEVGRIEPPALRAPVQKEQAALKAELDRAEKINDLLKSNAAMEPIVPRVEALLKRLGGVSGASAWMRTTYRPLLARVQATLQRVPAERCRKTLLAELDFIEVDTNKALSKADTKALQSRAVPQLQRIERLAARITALSPALDRELARIAKLVKAGNAPAELAKRLKQLVEAKTGAWPAGATADDIERSLAAYEVDVAKLAALAQKLPATAQAAKP